MNISNYTCHTTTVKENHTQFFFLLDVIEDYILASTSLTASSSSAMADAEYPQNTTGEEIEKCKR